MSAFRSSYGRARSIPAGWAAWASSADSPFNLLGKHNDDTTGDNTRRTRHVQRLHTNFGEFRVPGLRQVGERRALHAQWQPRERWKTS